MPSFVLLTDDAAHDLEEIHDYIARHDSISRANHVLERIEKVFASLSESPQRGSYPKELLDVGIREYREVFFKPYRIIYREIEDDVYVLVIADGRRDMRLPSPGFSSVHASLHAELAATFLRSLVGAWADARSLYPLLGLRESGHHAVLVYAFEGNDATHWQIGCSGRTWSTRCAAVSATRRAP